VLVFAVRSGRAAVAGAVSSGGKSIQTDGPSGAAVCFSVSGKLTHPSLTDKVEMWRALAAAISILLGLPIGSSSTSIGVTWD
jgi:hypothetical protein